MKENKDKGFIALYRSLQEHYLYPHLRKFTEFEAWIDLLLTANYKDAKILIDLEMQELKRGSFLTSELKLSFRWFWNRDRVRGFLKLLEKDLMIVKQSTKKYTIITICNYDQYQQITTTKQQQGNNRATTGQQQPDTDNKENKVNKENNLWAELVNKWLQYKTERRETYKSDESIRKFETRLKNLSKGNIETAVKIIDQSIANNWAGIFELKDRPAKQSDIMYR